MPRRSPSPDLDAPSRVTGFGVELVQWPRDEVLRDRLARAGVPRLLLVEADAAPPLTIGVDEDWVRLPADERDVAVRAARLARLSVRLSSERPVLDRNRVLHRGGATVVLSTAEAIVVDLLLANAGRIVPREQLESAVWPNGDVPSSKAVNAVVYRLRRRLAGLSLCVRAARGRGFVIFLEDQADDQAEDQADDPAAAPDEGGAELR